LVVLKLIPTLEFVATLKVTISVFVAEVELPGKALVFQLEVVLHATEPPFHDASAAFRFPVYPSITANSPTHFPSLKTEPAIFQTGRRGRRFGILDDGSWMLDVE
jgi:hypothetical protein